ncbi:helix-turn-helix domain-containing protein [Sphingobium aromaticiconvertens]|uniref:helix-turn-helix domain-containing protein n=1 Tax=Sphingobium aromaticiconvertens TaxID=365341 RepID=UPI003015CDCC
MARDLAVIAFDGVHLSSVGLFLDLFGLMRRRVADQFKSRDEIGMQTRTRLLGQGGHPVKLAGDRRLEVDEGLNDQVALLLIHVPDFEWPDGVTTMGLGNLRPIIGWLARQHAAGAHISATGRGIYLLAEAGLIGNGPVPLPQSAAAAFRLRYPRIRVDARTAILENDTIALARGVVHETSMLTRLVARLMSFSMAGALADVMGLQETERDGLSDDPLVAAAQIWLSAHSSAGARISELAVHLAVSQQTLIRHFRARLGMTPRAYLRLLRVWNAQSQLRETSRPIAQIATIVGYDDLKSFQEAFRAHTGMCATRYRVECRASAAASSIKDMIPHPLPIV